jgi:hypothetical protein
MQVLSIVRLGGDEAFAERRENISILEHFGDMRVPRNVRERIERAIATRSRTVVMP